MNFLQRPSSPSSTQTRTVSKSSQPTASAPPRSLSMLPTSSSIESPGSASKRQSGTRWALTAMSYSRSPRRIGRKRWPCSRESGCRKIGGESSSTCSTWDAKRRFRFSRRRNLPNLGLGIRSRTARKVAPASLTMSEARSEWL